MKPIIFLLTIVLLMSNSIAQNGKAVTVRKTFSRETAISIEIQAEPAIVWALLTHASDYPRWNSTVTSLEGNIALGEKVKLKSTLDAKRTFKLKVKEFEPETRLVWGDGQGNREYLIIPNGDGKVTFSMREKIGSPMFPLYAKMIPSFDASFEAFAADLKKEVEKIQKG